MTDNKRIAYDTNESYHNPETGLYSIAKIEENEPGFWRLPMEYDTLEAAKVEVNRLNDALGLHPGDVLDICASSMAAHNAQKYGEPDPETAHKQVSDLLGPEVGLPERQAILAIVGELEARLAEATVPPKIEVLHVRQGDFDCSIRLWIDGVEVKEFWSEDLDPGRGYSVENWDENRRDALDHPELSEGFRAAVDQAYADTRDDKNIDKD